MTHEDQPKVSNKYMKPSDDLVEPIAIVGVGCRLPGGISTVEDLAAALRQGRDCVTEIPGDRWNVDSYYDPDPITPGKTYVRHGGFMTEIDRFDAAFFNISDVEAARIDPQQRIALETVWHAIEHGGQSADELLRSNTGMFLAMMNTNGYSQLKGAYEGLQGITAYDAMGDAMSITAGRIAHFLGLEGPCFAIDTACSGSMVAVHLARQSILAGECDSAIVVGVSTILHPGIHIAFSKVGLMSHVGKCAAFDADADGYVRGEGCMAVLLRRQSLAIERGDNILATIVGSAINHDGRTPALTAPNGQTQEKVIRLALARVGVKPNDIGYVEAHGTGTPVGDPVEMSALANVYGPGRADEEPLFVGSVKSNFGHTESAAGLLGLVKAALSLNQGVIFPSLHFKRLNPNIDLGQAPIRVPTTAIPWPRSGRSRMVGVNSFGYSGTNAHAVLREAAPAMEGNELPIARPCEMVVMSAKNAGSLQALADSWDDFLQQDSPASLPSIAFTAATGRSHLRHRLAVVGRGKDDIASKLRAWRQGRSPKGLSSGQVVLKRGKVKIAFVFTGQGSQYAGMGRQLYETEPTFKATIDRCARLANAELEVRLQDVLFGPNASELLNNTRYVQPALFAIEYALADLVRSWGIEPDFVAGHSVGEIVAHCVAGAIDLDDAMRFVIARGQLMGQLPAGGRMAVIESTADEAAEWMRGREAEISLAAVNGPRSVVVSGEAEAVTAISEVAQASGRRSKELEVSHAFHSPLMDPILREIERAAARLRVGPTKIPLASNVYGRFLTDSVSADYWSSHVRRPVLFYEGIRSITEAGCSLLVEIGPHPALTPMISAAFDTANLRCFPTLLRDQQDVSNLFQTLASLYVTGMPVHLDRLFWNSAYRRVSLPLYPFRRDRHWLTTDFSVDTPPQPKVDLHPLLGRAISVGSRRAAFEPTISATHPWIDHRVLGSTVFPGTGYLEMAARGFAESKGRDFESIAFREVSFERPMLLAYGKANKLSLTIENIPINRSGEATFSIAAAGQGSNQNYCRGKFAAATAQAGRISVEGELARMTAKTGVGQFYGELRKNGLEYGSSFSTIRELWAGKPDSGEAVGRISAAPHGAPVESHPFLTTTLLDGCLQVFGAALTTLGTTAPAGTFVPVAIQSMTLWRQLPFEVWSFVTVRKHVDGRAALAHIRVFTSSGELLADIEGLELRVKSSIVTANDREISVAIHKPAGESRDQLVARVASLSKPEQVSVLSKWLTSEVKDILGQAASEIDLDNIDPSTAFLEIGLDSLLVTELQRRIQENFGFRFQPMQGLDYQSIESLALYILDEVLVVELGKVKEVA